MTLAAPQREHSFLHAERRLSVAARCSTQACHGFALQASQQCILTVQSLVCSHLVSAGLECLVRELTSAAQS